MSEYRVDVTKETFEKITLFGHPMLFTNLRCSRKTLPKGLFMYEIRHDDDGLGEPCEIANWILVNHWGTVISNRPINLAELPSGRRFRMINAQTDWNYEGKTQTLKEYIEKNTPYKEYDR